MRRVLVYSLLVAVLIVVSGCAHVQPAYPPTSMVADATSAVVKVSGDNKQCSAVVVETVETDVIVSAAHCSAASKILINDHYVGTIRWTARSAFRDVAMGRYTSSQTIPRVKVASSQPPNDVPVESMPLLVDLREAISQS